MILRQRLLGRCGGRGECWWCRRSLAAVLAATRSPDVDGVLLWGYVLTQLLILPIAAAWAFAERTRWTRSSCSSPH